MSEPAPPLPADPPGPARLWAVWAAWVLGVPALVALVAGVIAAAWWATGGQIMPATEVAMVGVALGTAAIALLYPVMVWIWTAELREGLRAASDWAQLPPEAREAARRERAAAAPAVRPRRRTRRTRKAQ